MVAVVGAEYAGDLLAAEERGVAEDASKPVTSGNSRAQWNGRRSGWRSTPSRSFRRRQRASRLPLARASPTSKASSFRKSSRALAFLPAVARAAPISRSPSRRASNRAVSASARSRAFSWASRRSSTVKLSSWRRRSMALASASRQRWAQRCTCWPEVASMWKDSIWARAVTPSSESPQRRAWSRKVNARSFRNVMSQSESLAISTASGLRSTPQRHRSVMRRRARIRRSSGSAGMSRSPGAPVETAPSGVMPGAPGCPRSASIHASTSRSAR